MSRDFATLRNAMPACLVGSGCDDARTVEDLAFGARIELDLIEECQDGTEHYTKREIASIRRFIKKTGVSF